MLDLEVVPERSLGSEQWEFIIGMHFTQAVAIIQSQVGIIKGVEVLYNDVNPLEYDLCLDLPLDGIKFIFDSYTQRLKVIEVYAMKLVKLKYCGVTFNSPEITPTIQEIEQSFGATHPGIYDGERRLFVLNFRGLAFCFNVDSKFQPGSVQCGLGSLHFAPGVSPVVSKMILYSGNNLKISDLEESKNCYFSAAVINLPLNCYRGLPYVETATVIRDRRVTKGINLILYLAGCGSQQRQRITVTRELLFGMTCQDVATLLGSPSQIFYKSEDKMKIHSPNAHLHVTTSRRSDFIFNYFSLGMDVLFDAKCQRMKKLILHTNYPGHYNFNMYNRCDFVLNLESEKEDDSLSDLNDSNSAVAVTAFTKWEDISKHIKHSERPVVLNRTVCVSPFGSTFCYGYQDIIFEVMQNQHIASLTFYKTVADIAEL